MKLEEILSQHAPNWENAASKGIEALADAIEFPTRALIVSAEESLEQLKTRLSQLSNHSINLNRADALAAFNQKILEAIPPVVFPKEKMLSPVNPLLVFDSALQEFLASTPIHTKVIQDEKRFSFLASDSFLVKVGKSLKISHRFFQRAPVKISNSFKKTAQKKDFPFNYQYVPLRSLSKVFLVHGSNVAFRPYLEEFIQSQAQIISRISKNDAAFHDKVETFIHVDPDFDHKLIVLMREMEAELKAIQKKIDNDKVEFIRHLSKICQSQWLIFAAKSALAGTFEFSNKAISQRAEKKFRRRQHSWFRNYYLGWENTRVALIDDLAFSCELEAFQFSAFHSWFVAHQRLKAFLQKVMPQLDHIEQVLLQSKQRLLQPSMEIKTILGQERLELLKIIERKLLPDLLESLSDYNYVHIIGQSESKVLSSSAKITTTRLLVRQLEASTPLFSPSISRFNPQELILLEAIPAFNVRIDSLKSSAISFTEKANQDLQDITRIVAFNLSSAQELGEVSSMELENFISEGFERGFDKLRQIGQEWQQAHISIEENYKSALLLFVNQILQLRQNESLYQLRMRLLKARAAHRLKDLAASLKSKLATSFNKTLTWARLGRIKSQSQYYWWREQLGIKNPSRKISMEVTDFLAQRELAYQKLPFVYRRLFSNEPLIDTSFYYPRHQEFQKLKKAFEKWLQSPGLSVLIYGQKGSGVSSFLNFSIPRIFTEQSRVHRLVFSEEVTSKEQLLSVLGMLMREKSFENREELQDYLVHSDKHPVIILEGIHRLFLRKTGGFEPIKALFEIISDSSALAFWLCSCPLQPHNFLNKTIGLSDIFAIGLKMSSLSPEQIVDLIYKRHRTSGFKVVFEPCSGDLIRKSFVKLSDSQKQECLRKSYFDCLQRFSSNNISFALQMWVYSITKIKDNTIFVMSLRELDFSFLEGFSQKILFSLHAFIIHDELSSLHHAKVLNLDPHASSQILRHLTDKGILFHNNNVYFIHPLLYKQTVDLLESKNIIH